jgi:hypothetical protein
MLMTLGDKRKVALLLALANLSGIGRTQPVPSSTPTEVQKLLQNCDAHKFEAIIEATVDGQPHRSRMRLCGTEGQSDADWIKTLKDAVDKTAASTNMPQPVKDQVISALNIEIARLTALLPKPSPTVSALPPPRPKSTPKDDLASTYGSLPPLPTAPTVETPHYIAPNMPLLARPRMKFSCYAPSDVGGPGPCIEFERETLLTVRADEDLPNGTSIRFVRNGERRADVQLAQLKRGKELRFALPRDVCAGVVGAKLEMQVVRNAPGTGADGQVVGREGPYNLRC